MMFSASSSSTSLVTVGMLDHVQLLGQIGERRIGGDGHMSENITLDDVVLLNNAFSLSMLGPVEKFL